VARTFNPCDSDVLEREICAVVCSSPANSDNQPTATFEEA
jgi:hypothetical protein